MLVGMFVRLVGLMPQVVMGVFGGLREAIVNALKDVAENIAGVMTDWATWGIRTELTILSGNVLPGPKELLDSPISLLLGATYGLAGLISRMMIIVAVLVTLLLVFSQRRTDFGIARRTASSIVTLLVFTILFFPVYTLLMSGLRDFCVAILAATAKSNGTATEELSDQLIGVLSPENIVLQFLAGFVNGIVASIVVSELTSIVAVFLIVLVFYPLSIALRPLGSFGLAQFRATTAAVISIPASLFAMSFLLAMELLLIRSANRITPFLGGYATLILSIVFGLAVLLAPFVVFMLTYRKVVETVGSQQARLAEGIDVASMPDVNARQIGDDNTRDKMSYVKQFATELPGAIATGENSAGTEAKELAKQIGLQAAAKSGNPIVTGAAATYTGIKLVTKLGDSDNNKGGDTP